VVKVLGQLEQKLSCWDGGKNKKKKNKHKNEEKENPKPQKNQGKKKKKKQKQLPPSHNTAWGSFSKITLWGAGPVNLIPVQ